MIKKRKSFVIELLFIILVLFGLSFFCFAPTLLFGKSFTWYNDQQFQFNIFYREWYHIIRECVEQRIPAIYSWNDFLGSDFYVTKLMYCVGDFIATPYFLLHKGEVDFDRLFAIESLLCVVLSGLTMRHYLQQFGIQKTGVRLSVSILYALSGFASLFCGSYMFMRFYALLPLLFASCEKYIHQGKLVGFALVTSLLFLQNYELMFSTSIFLILYFIFTEKLQYKKHITSILKDALPLIGSYLTGIAIVGFALLPQIIYLRSNTRVGSLTFGDLFWSLESNFAFLFGHLIPPFNYRGGYFAYPFYTGFHFGNEFSCFLGVAVVLAYIQIARARGTEKKCFLLGRLILSLFLLVRPLNMVVHGLSEPTFRWSFLLILFDSVTLSYYWDRYPQDSAHKKTVFIILVVATILAGTYCFLRHNVIYLPYFIIAILSALTLFWMQKSHAHAQILSVIMSIGFFATTIVLPYSSYGQEDVGLNEEYLTYYMQQDESSFYRIHIPAQDISPFSNLNLNTSLRYRYPSVSTYSSTYETVLTPFITANGIENWLIEINDPEVLAMLGCKYYVVLDESELPKGDFSYVYDLDNLHVYHLNNANEIAHTYTEFAITDSLPESPDWNSVLYVKSQDAELLDGIAKGEKAQMQVIERNGQYMQGRIITEGKSVLLITIPYSKGWNVIDSNGEKLTTINVQGGFLGVLLPEGDHILNFYYGTPGLKTGLLLSTFGIICLIPLYIFQKKRVNSAAQTISSENS